VEKCIIYAQLSDFFLSKQKNTCFLILNDKSNCHVSMILMNPRPIYVKRSENDSVTASACHENKKLSSIDSDLTKKIIKRTNAEQKK
jgi:hypothetical protein